jgi:lipid A 3-O-deacylase
VTLLTYSIGYNWRLSGAGKVNSDFAGLFHMYSHRPFKTDRRESGRWSLYGLLGLRGSAVAYDITLDGPVFSNFDTGVTREPFVGELFAGLGVRYRNLDITYVQTYRSHRFKEQNKAGSFGSIVVSYRL